MSTIHTPNARVWKAGDIVIHDSDAKTADMLMTVIGRVASGPNKGKFRTRYTYPDRQPKAWRRKVWINPIEKLHDPARFAIPTTVESALTQVRMCGHSDEELQPITDAIRQAHSAVRFTANSYARAIAFIDAHPGCGGAVSLSKLILSLWNDEAAYSFRECVSNLDDARTAIAVDMVREFAANGETEELVKAGYYIHGKYPLLWDVGVAGDEAKRVTRRSLEEAREKLRYDRGE
jgi:hypothetical protein